MFKRLFAKTAAQRPKTPEGVCVYAIGDVHGCADLLNPLLESLFEEILRQPSSRSRLVMLGDYVDRGPRSNLVLQTLATLKERSPIEVRFLMGNHDETFLQFLSDPQVGATWCEFGGRETLMSYGVEPPAFRDEAQVWSQVQAEFRAAVPQRHVDFLKALELSCVYGDFAFVHAGLRPGVALEHQSQRDLLWIREGFLGDPRRLDHHVVHGHTPTEEPHADHRRIGVDTGAYATGVLTAVKLFGEQVSYIQARRKGGGGVEIVRAAA